MRIRAEEVVHKMTYRRIITILPVYIDYAGFVPIINVSHVFYTSGYFVQFLSASEIIPLGNKYDISSGEVFEIIAGIGRINVQQAAVVSSSFRNRTAVTALNLDIVFHSIGINSVDIQSSGTSLQILYFKLRLRVLDCKVVLVQYYPEQQFGALLVFENLAHECVVHKPELLYRFFLDFAVVKQLIFVCHRDHRPFLNYNILLLKNQASVLLILNIPRRQPFPRLFRPDFQDTSYAIQIGNQISAGRSRRTRIFRHW